MTAQVARQAVADGMCVVIGLQSTGEANTKSALDEAGAELDDFVSAPKVIMQHFLERQFPVRAALTDAELRQLKAQARASEPLLPPAVHCFEDS
jgi:uncharacterized membrane protein